MNHHKRIMKMILAALFLALAYVLPFLTGHISKIGSMLCPMHLPVLLCGFICGPFWGMVIGSIVPIFRSLMLGMPALFPTAVCMTFELATYGAVAGIMHRILPRKKVFIYCSLLTAMVTGRLVWGAAMHIVVGMSGGTFTLAAFMAGAFINAIPGIIAQIILVPILVMLLDNPNILKLRE